MPINSLKSKQIDFWVQSVLIAIWFTAILPSLLAGYFILPQLFFILYFIVGIWQTGSALLNKKPPISGNRLLYYRVMTMVFIVSVLSYPLSYLTNRSSLFLAGMAMLVLAPILALFYLRITWDELQAYKLNQSKQIES